MGILGLSKLIADIAPQAVKEMEIKNYFGTLRFTGRKVAIDASMSLYQFLIAVRSEGDQASIEKFNRRLVKVTRQHGEEARELLKLMGVPVVEAPCEAEAQCAALVKAGKVYATATEDMDALTFGANVLLRHLTFSEARKMPVQEFHLDQVLKGLELNHTEFIDLCILLGCDYCGSIRGIGPKRAIELIKQHRSIEQVLHNIDSNKYQPPEDWDFTNARRLFVEPEITDPKDIEVLSTTPNPKRKAEEEKKNAANKKAKTGGGRGRKPK
ncbi:Flap endonuclease 1 [Papilio machaon]|uniref:Flap endonuclease 1 n=1 Tax=Papilio machaon TaxID=76193 RepID=A0A194QRY0_PAPMA|nr:Flap endonuclease 1 [Papilio machaon]